MDSAAGGAKRRGPEKRVILAALVGPIVTHIERLFYIAPMDDLIITVDGVTWRKGASVNLPRHHTIGFFTRGTAFGSGPNNAFWHAGCWRAAEDLKAQKGIEAFDAVTGVRFPAKEIVIVDSVGERRFIVTTGFVLGALYEIDPMRCVYLALYLDENGRRRPRMIKPTSWWLNQQQAARETHEINNAWLRANGKPVRD